MLSAFTRLSSTELANVSSGGGMVPIFIIKKSCVKKLSKRMSIAYLLLISAYFANYQEYLKENYNLFFAQYF